MMSFAVQRRDGRSFDRVQPEKERQQWQSRPSRTAITRSRPYLVVAGAAMLIDFLEAAFDAEEVERLDGAGRTVSAMPNCASVIRW